MQLHETWLKLLLLLSLSLVCDAARPLSLVGQTEASIDLPVGSFSLTPYFRPSDGQMLAHFQPKNARQTDLLIDARTGLAAAVSARELADEFQRLGMDDAEAVARGRAPDHRQLTFLGCSPPLRYCTSPADADVVLMSSLPQQGNVKLVVKDMRPLLSGLEQLLAGQRPASEWQVDESTWTWLELAASQSSRRERWLDALRSIDTVSRWQLVYSAFVSGPRLGQRPQFQWDEKAAHRIDLREELERANFRIQIQLFTQAWVQTSDSKMLDSLVGVLRGSYQLGQTTGMTAYLVDVLTDQPVHRQARIADALTAAAIRSREHTLWCYAQWISAKSCDALPPWQASASKSTVGNSVVSSQQSATTRTPQTGFKHDPKPEAKVKLGVPGIGIDIPSASGLDGLAGDAQQEMSLVKRLTNGLVLLAFDERSGKLKPEAGGANVNGFAFVARSLGTVGSGQFAIQMMPAAKSPVKLSLGSYRVRVQLALDYTREDRCNAGFFCRFTDPERYAKSARKELVFRVTPQNRHTDEQTADFKHLQPLVAEGNGRYSSELKDARLAILSARFESL